jgi:hypothetical protein
MPPYRVVVTDARTYEVEAATKRDAIERGRALHLSGAVPKAKCWDIEIERPWIQPRIPEAICPPSASA